MKAYGARMRSRVSVILKYFLVQFPDWGSSIFCCFQAGLVLTYDMMLVHIGKGGILVQEVARLILSRMLRLKCYNLYCWGDPEEVLG